MRRPTSGMIVARALGASLACAACTTTVPDGNPFGMGDGSTAATTEASESGSEPSSASDGGSSGGDSSGTVEDTSSSGASTDSDTSVQDCNPPCDPLVAVCEAGQCAAPAHPEPGQVVFTELMPNPSLITDDLGEWIELANVGTEPVDLEGCVLYGDVDDEDVVDTGAPIIVPPGGLVVLGKVVDPAQNGGVAGVVYGFGTAYSLTNTGDRVELACGGATIDEVVYLDTWPFTAGAAMQLSSAALDAVANDAQGSWCTATAAYGVGELGTPGQANGGC